MSATGRNKKGKPAKPKMSQEYYVTPNKTILEFWSKFYEVESLYHFVNTSNLNQDLQFNKILDPCCGGDAERSPAYPFAFSIEKVPGIEFTKTEWTYIDIREDAPGAIHEDYLKMSQFIEKFDLVISNPPFTLFEGFVKKAYEDIKDDGYIIYLLRINCLAGQKRNHIRNFWKKFPAKYMFVHSCRPHFIPGSSATDATEYAHFVWQKGYDGPLLTHII